VALESDNNIILFVWGEVCSRLQRLGAIYTRPIYCP